MGFCDVGLLFALSKTRARAARSTAAAGNRGVLDQHRDVWRDPGPAASPRAARELATGKQLQQLRGARAVPAREALPAARSFASGTASTLRVWRKA
jgi:hypothetical protein